MTFHIITLFPKSFRSYLRESIVGRALEKEIIRVAFYNPRTYAAPRHRYVDDRPYGGGPGMVLMAEPILKAVRTARRKAPNARVILFTPRGKQLRQDHVHTYARKKHIIFIAGRYEGVDARVKRALGAEEVSIGPYVLSGGELPALVFLEAVTRSLPGVLGKNESLHEASRGGRIYTRPRTFVWEGKRYQVPHILTSGDHKKIKAYRTRGKRLR